MKSYSRVISKLFYEPAMILPSRHAALCQLLEARLEAAKLSGKNSGAQLQGPGGDDQSDDQNGAEDEVQLVADTVIIPVHGTLVAHPEDIAMSECGCDMETLGKRIDMAEYDPKIKRVVYDFRTPGGTVTLVPETARKIASSQKETIGFTDSECCSGGIYLASQCQKFYATKSSRVGSVGVYTMCLDMTKALEADGVKVNAISAGKYKLLGAYWKELAEDERAILQKGVDKIYAEFKEAMEAYRMVNDKNFGNGLVFDGDEAFEIGFTDGVVEDLEEAMLLAEGD